MSHLALKTLFADRGKLFTAILGVVFSVCLVNVQGGLFVGLIRKASLLVDNGQADIWVGHKQMHNVDFPRDIPRRWMYRIRSVPGVEVAQPYLIGYAEMTLPSGGFEGVVVIGVDRATLLGNAWNMVEGTADSIHEPDGVIVDEGERDRLQHPQIGELREINGKRARIVAKSHGIMGFLVTPYVFTTYDRAVEYLRKSPDACSYLLVRTEDGAGKEQIRKRIAALIPEAEVLTREQYSRTSVDFWMKRTGLGISFGAATLLGVFVGLVIVGQTLFTMVTDRIDEYGTLKILGAREPQVLGIILVQAFVVAAAGSVLGLGFVALIQQSYSTPRAPILIPTWMSWSSCLLVLTVCLGSALLPYLRTRRIDPIMVLQG